MDSKSQGLYNLFKIPVYILELLDPKYTELEFKLTSETLKAQILSHFALLPHLYVQSYIMPHDLFFSIKLNNIYCVPTIKNTLYCR